MEPERCGQAEKICLTALERESEQRQAYLDEVCAGDSSLRSEVEALLARKSRAKSSFEPVGTDAAAKAPDEDSKDGLHPDLTGSTLSHYRIVEKIGEGGMGVVYRAEDIRLRRIVALKFVRPVTGAEERARCRFLREAQAAAALSHPNICVVHEVDDVHGFIAMEYVEGETVSAKISRGALPVGEAVAIAIQAAQGLQAAHAKGIIHRDIKSSNLMVKADGLVKVMDFGLAATGVIAETDFTQDQLTKCGEVVGTLSYMSPEQAAGKPTDCRGDIWSLTVVLFEMLTGGRPFSGQTAASVLHALLYEPVCLNAIQMPIRSVIAKGLAKNPTQRYQQMQEMLVDLRPAETAVGQALAAEDLAGQPAIAVLPFVNLSDEKQNEYFSDGLAEEIINALAKIPGLRVTARTSSFVFRGRDHDIHEIAARLNVGFVLEGSVQKAGGRIRVTTQLVDTAGGYDIWSERFDREIKDIFTIQDEICEAVVGKLRVQLLGNAPLAKRYTQNVEAYNLFLRGRYHQFGWTREGIEKSKLFFEHALAEDPRFALAHVGVAMYYLHSGFFGFVRPAEALPQCESALREALSLDETLSEAHAMLGVLLVIRSFDWQDAERRFLRALKLDPTSVDSQNFYDYYFLVPMGRFDECIAQRKLALERDPLSAFHRFSLGFRYLLKRQYDLAREQLRIALELDSTYHAAYWALATIYHQRGMLEEAASACERFVDLSGRSPWALGSLGFALGRAGRVGEARKLLRELVELDREGYVAPSNIAHVCFGLGESDRGFAFLDRAVDESDGMILHLGVDPFYDFLRSDARYHDLLRKIRLEACKTASDHGG